MCLRNRIIKALQAAAELIDYFTSSLSDPPREFRLVASARSTELFIAALLFVIVSTGFVAAVAGLSMALGAFLAGLLLAETEYRKVIEATIEPFKGLLLGLFFSVGMGLDVRELVRYPVSLPAGAPSG